MICPGCPACISGDLPEFENDDEIDKFFATHLPWQFNGYVGEVPDWALHTAAAR